MIEMNSKCPTEVVWLGYGGLLPFIGLAIAGVVDPLHSPRYAQALMGYGAVILSFVGALHWGFAMTAGAARAQAHRRAFVWSVMPALMAWAAIVLQGAGGVLILVAGFLLQLSQDVRLARPAALARWYLPLRWRLTVVAVGCLVVGLGGNGW